MCTDLHRRGCRFSFKIDGWFMSTDGVSIGAEEGYADIRVDLARKRTAIYAALMRMCGEDHLHGPTGLYLLRVLRRDVLTVETQLYEEGHSLGAVGRYMEIKHNLKINIRGLRRRIEAEQKKGNPRGTDLARLVQNRSAY